MSSGPTCPADVGGKPCGKKMDQIDDWTYLCAKHGEMH